MCYCKTCQPIMSVCFGMEENGDKVEEKHSSQESEAEEEADPNIAPVEEKDDENQDRKIDD